MGLFILSSFIDGHFDQLCCIWLYYKSFSSDLPDCLYCNNNSGVATLNFQWSSYSVEITLMKCAM